MGFLAMFRLEKILNTQAIANKVGQKGPLPPAAALVKTTLNTALPSITECFLIALVGIVDSFMVSGLGDYAISAVGLTTQPKFLFLAVFFAISQAVSALVARRRGEGKLNEAAHILRHALVIAAVLAVVLSILGVLLADNLMRFIGSQPDTHDTAVTYFVIIIGGMFFNVITMVINAAQRGVGNTSIAMKTNIISNAVNVVFNFLLIEGRFGFPRLEVAGAAIATVLGSVVAMVMAIYSVSRTGARINILHGFTLRLRAKIVKSITRLSLPAMGEQLIMRFGFTMYYMLIAYLGTNVNAAHHIGMNFLSISFSLADGLSVAAIALVGKSLGEKRQDLARIYSAICQRLGFVASCLVALIYIPFGRLLFSLFSRNEEVLAYGYELMAILSVVVFVQITMIIFVSCLRAAGDVKYVAMISLLCIGLIRPLSAYLLCYPLGLGLAGAWLGMLIDQCFRLALSYNRYRKGKWLNIVI